MKLMSGVISAFLSTIVLMVFVAILFALVIAW